MRCSFCGKEVGEGERICKYCGTVLAGSAERGAPREYTEEQAAERRSGYSDIEKSDFGETRVFRRPNVPSGFENSMRVHEELNRRHQQETTAKRQYYRYNPEEEARRAKKSKSRKAPIYKQKKAKPVRKNRHIGRTIMGLVFKAALGFVIGFLLYILVINIGGWLSEAFENIDIPFLNNLLN